MAISNSSLPSVPDGVHADELTFWRALGEIFPGTSYQRCWVHKAANDLNSIYPAEAALREVGAGLTS